MCSKTAWYRITICCVLQVLAASAVLAFGTNADWRVRLYGTLERFEWEETYAGFDLLQETGPVFGLGAEFDFPVIQSLRWEGKGELYYGKVDYNGYIQYEDGSLAPYESKTEYFGLKLETDLAWRPTIAQVLSIGPLAGLGTRVWQRRLDATGDRKYGYDENWIMLYGLLGVGANAKIFSQTELFARAVLRFPFLNTETINVSDQGDSSTVVLRPGNKVSLYLEGGLVVDMIFLSVYYEQLRFSESNLDEEYEILQPESSADIFGIKAGWNF